MHQQDVLWFDVIMDIPCKHRTLCVTQTERFRMWCQCEDCIQACTLLVARMCSRCNYVQVAGCQAVRQRSCVFDEIQKCATIAQVHDDVK